MLETLDIAIGLVLVFTLTSLLSSILNEWVSGILALRGRMLWKGIDRMLGAGLSGEVCQHHLMQSLVWTSWFDRLAKWLKRSKPAYVPTETFALALLDVLGGRAQAAAGAAPPNLQALLGAVNALPPGAARNELVKLVNDQGNADPVGGAIPTTLAGLTAAVNALPPGGLRNGLQALVEAAGTATGSAKMAPAAGAAAGAPAAPVLDPLEIAKKNIGQWYDDAMDRVSGAYKRWSQLSLLVIGFVVAAVLGIDTIAIGKALQTNPALRAAAVKAADAYVNDHQKPKDAGAPVQGSGQGSRAPAPPGAAVDSSRAPVTPSPAEVEKRLNEVRQQLAGLDFPFSPASQRTGTLPEWLWCHLGGFLLTALATSLGAPFWFDLLNRFVNLRAAGKKPEPQQAKS
jgi:hypothetical protein